jgi:flagellar hook-associated protein 3 FlgL
MINATGNRMTHEIRRQSQLAQTIALTQTRISTGRRIQQASDDPVAAARVAVIRQSQADDGAWRSNLDLGLSLAAEADSIMRSVSDSMARAQTLVISAASGTLSPADRQTVALELRGIADQFDEAAATRSSTGDPLFQAQSARQFRFSNSVAFAPVPDAASVFTVNGNSLSQMIRDVAASVATGDSPAINAGLNRVEAGVTHVADTAASIGVKAQRMERMREHMIERGIESAAERSGLEDTDLSTAIATLNAQTLTLEAAQSAFARINRRTLMDILS